MPIPALSRVSAGSVTTPMLACAGPSMMRRASSPGSAASAQLWLATDLTDLLYQSHCYSTGPSSIARA